MRKYNLFRSLESFETLEWKISPSSLVATAAVTASTNAEGSDPAPSPEPAPNPDGSEPPPIVYPYLPPSGPSGPGS